MTQVTQEEYNPEKLTVLLESNPKASNKEIYAYCSATTDSQKGYLRKKKSRLSKKDKTQKIKKAKKIIANKKITKLNESILESLICDMINGESAVKESKIRIAVDFYNKVKTDKGEEIEEIDMDGYLKVYDTIKE